MTMLEESAEEKSSNDRPVVKTPRIVKGYFGGLSRKERKDTDWIIFHPQTTKDTGCETFYPSGPK